MHCLDDGVEKVNDNSPEPGVLLELRYERVVCNLCLLILILQITELARDIVHILNIVCLDLEVASSALQDKIDQVAHSHDIVSLISLQPVGGSVFACSAPTKNFGCRESATRGSREDDISLP